MRFELAKSRVMDTNLDTLQNHFLEVFSSMDYDNSGFLSLIEVRGALLTSKKAYLTPF